MEELQLDRRVVCRQEKLRYLAFGTKRNFLDTQHFCRTLSGDIAVTTGRESVQDMQESLENIGGTHTCGQQVYAGLVKKDETWYDVRTARPAQWAEWRSSGSDDSYSHCVQLEIKTGQEDCLPILVP